MPGHRVGSACPVFAMARKFQKNVMRLSPGHVTLTGRYHS